MPSIPKPTRQYVSGRMSEFDNNPRYFGAERTVQLAFGQWPRNDVCEQVLLKTIVLNRLYSTNIFDVFTVANHIVALKIDERLWVGDAAIVDMIADVKFEANSRYLYSFSSKYCAWHSPNHFQIYDSYVDWLLCLYQDECSFAAFQKYELREYPSFLGVIDTFRKKFDLQHLIRI
jgi:hypothetical protein